MGFQLPTSTGDRRISAINSSIVALESSPATPRDPQDNLLGLDEATVALHRTDWGMWRVATFYRRERSPQEVVKSKGIRSPKWPKHSGSGFIINCPDEFRDEQFLHLAEGGAKKSQKMETFIAVIITTIYKLSSFVYN